MKCKRHKEKIMLYLYDELSEKECSELEKHLKECSECSRDLAYTKEVFNTLDSGRKEKIPEGNWEKSWQIISSRIEEKPEKKKRFFYEYRKAFAIAGALSVFILGIVIGRYLLTFRQQTTLVSVTSPASLDQTLSEHFENLKPILIEYANYSPSEKRKSTITIDREIFKSLILQNYLLKRAVANMNNPSQEQLLEDIDLILREISNLKGVDKPTLSLIKDTINQRDILFKMEIFQKI